MALKKRRIVICITALSVLCYYVQKLRSTEDKGWRKFKNHFKVATESVPVHDIKGLREVVEPHQRDHSRGIFPLPANKVGLFMRPNDSVVPEMFYKQQKNVSLHEFRMLLNPYTTCLDSASGKVAGDVFLVVLIASATWEFDRRKIIRRTWASLSRCHDKTIKYVFFTGKDGNNQNNRKLLEEFDLFGDIVQEDYKETYRNLTLKTQGQLKWVTYFCPVAQYYLHIDDDVVPDIKSIVKQHLDMTTSRLLSCAKVFKPRVRREGKWSTSIEEYPGDQYPLSCVGWCFMMSKDVAVDLYYMSLDTPLLHLEDVAFTGIIREKISDIKISKMKDGENMCYHKGWPKDKPTNIKILETWDAIQSSV